MAKKLTPAENNELATLLQGKAVDHAKAEAAKAKADNAALAASTVQSLHTLAVKMATSEGALDKAHNAVYQSFKAYALVALPLIVKSAAHEAAIKDIHSAFGEARKAAAIQRVTMLNNMRTIVHGKAATRDTAAQPAQGMDIVQQALDACTALPALKSALVALKSAKHAATGVAKTEPKAKAEKAVTAKPVKAEDVQIPSTRAEALKAACRILEMVARDYFTLSDNRKEIDQVNAVVAMLKKAA